MKVKEYKLDFDMLYCGSMDKQKKSVMKGAIIKVVVGAIFTGALLFPDTSQSIAIGLVAGGMILFVQGAAELIFLRG